MTKKIGIDARMYSASSGIGRYILELTKRIFAANPDCHFVIFLPPSEFANYVCPPNVRKIEVDCPHYSLSEQTKFCRILNRQNCDLVHFCNFNFPIFYGIFRRRKCIVTIHDTTLWFFPGRKMNSFFQKIAYRLVLQMAAWRSTKIITVSEHTKKDIQNLLHVRAEKIVPTLLAAPKNDEKFSETEKNRARKKFGISENFLIFTGNWREHKNLLGLLRAFKILISSPSQKTPPNLQLVISGEKDPHYPEILDQIADPAISNRIKLLGTASFHDLQALTSAAKILVFPSFYEGFGMPPLQAMALGTPVAAANRASIPEVCADAAVYFDPENIQNMAHVIGDLLTNSAKQSELAARGKARASEFSWEQTAERTWEVYQMGLKDCRNRAQK